MPRLIVIFLLLFGLTGCPIMTKSMTKNNKQVTPPEIYEKEGDGSNPQGFNIALQLYQQQNYSQAADEFRLIIERHPNHSESHRFLGDCMYNMMEFEEARRSYDTAYRLNPQNYFALRGIGFASLYHGYRLFDQLRIDDAHAAFQESLTRMQTCLRMRRGDLDAYFGRAMAAEGASRKLYKNAEDKLTLGDRFAAEAERRICDQVINEGLESIEVRIHARDNEVGPFVLKASLLYRRARLYKMFGMDDEANSLLNGCLATYRKVRELDPTRAEASIREAESTRELWDQQSARGGRW